MPRGKDQNAVVTLAEIEERKAKGMTQAAIAREFGVTRAYISWIIKEYGGTRSPRQIALEESYPWKVWSQHRDNPLYMLTREHVVNMIGEGHTLSEARQKRLERFYQRLRDFNMVVEYDPVNIEPSPGNSKGGFAYVPRVESDGDLIIRVNDHTELSPKSKLIWRFPPDQKP